MLSEMSQANGSLEAEMIKVMIGFNKKPGIDIQPTIQKIKAFAMTFQ